MLRSRDTPTDAETVALAIHELLRRVRFDDVRAVCRWGLTRTECHVLEVVALDGPLTVNDVAARIRLNKSTASRSVQSLSGKGLLRRSTDAADARALAVETTSQGTTIWKQIVRSSAAVYGEVLDELTPAERKAVLRLLRRITEYATTS